MLIIFQVFGLNFRRKKLTINLKFNLVKSNTTLILNKIVTTKWIFDSMELNVFIVIYLIMIDFKLAYKVE